MYRRRGNALTVASVVAFGFDPRSECQGLCPTEVLCFARGRAGGVMPSRWRLSLPLVLTRVRGAKGYARRRFCVLRAGARVR